MMTTQQDIHKKAAALAALKYVEEGMIIGVGTGSTTNFFIDALATLPFDIKGAVSSSRATTARLKSLGIEVFDPNATGDIQLYVDGADEVNHHGYMIKGGGGALTGEKIIASMARTFICIVDQSKCVDVLGQFPVPIEVLPMARSFVARQLVLMNADPMYREGFTTDHGNIILDAYHLKLTDPMAVESQLNQIPGVVAHGIFAKRHANLVLVGTDQGVTSIKT